MKYILDGLFVESLHVHILVEYRLKVCLT